MVWRATALNRGICEDIPKRNKWPCDVIDGIHGDDEAEAKEKALPPRFWNADYEGLAANDQPSYEAGERANQRQHITTTKASTRSGQEAARRSPELRTRFAPIPVQGDSRAGPSFRGGLTKATISRSKRETPATRRLPAAWSPGKGHLP
jgi:hypothetical protein